MRIVIHLNDYDPDDVDIVHEVHCVPNPGTAADDRAVVPGLDVEWFPFGGNIHVVDDDVIQAAELLDGSTMVETPDGITTIRDSVLAAVYPED